MDGWEEKGGVTTKSKLFFGGGAGKGVVHLLFADQIKQEVCVCAFPANFFFKRERTPHQVCFLGWGVGGVSSHHVFIEVGGGSCKTRTSL